MMSLMCVVMASNICRVLINFRPFAALLNDRFLSIRTYNPHDPKLTCLYTLTYRTIKGSLYPPGLYIHANRQDEELTLYHPTKDLDEVDEILTIINVHNVYNEQAMDLVGLIPCCPRH